MAGGLSLGLGLGLNALGGSGSVPDFGAVAPYILTARPGSFAFTGDSMTTIFGQTLSLEAGSFALTGQDATISAGGSYSAEALAVFAAMTTPPDNTRKALIDACIVGLKSDGVWALGDVLQVYAAADSQAGRVDWILPSRVATLTNSPTFTTDRGFTTNGTNNYVDTLFNPTAGTNYLQDSASFGVWSRTSGQLSTGGSGWFDGTDGVTINTRNTSDQTAYRINHATATATSASSVTDGSGMFAVNRSASNATQIYRNGSAIGSGGSAASTALNSATLRVGSITAASFQAREFAAVWAGGSLDATKQLALYNRLQTYMTAVGA